MSEKKEMIEKKVIEVFSKYSNSDVDLLFSIEELELDSLGFVKLIIELEDSFGIEIDDEKLYVAQGVKIQDFCDFIEERVDK